MRSRRHPLIALGLVGALVLAACGDDSGSATTSTASEAPTSTTTTVGEAGVADGASVEPAPSEGCSASATALEPESVQTITVRGDEREYQRHVPPAHDGELPVPLVVDLHGYQEGAQIHAQHSALGPFGDEKGFATVTPQGLGAVPFWDIAQDGADIEFIGDLLDTEEAALCVDTNRVFVTGLSNGAFMTSALACAYSDRIAAAAPVAGIRDQEGCEFDRPVPVVAFHGTDDQFVSYDGGLGPAVADLPSADGSGESLVDAGELAEREEAVEGGSVPELTAAWAERNGCEGDPTETSVADDVTLIEFPCDPNATTELYRVDGGGHSWPGSDFSVQIEDVVGFTTFSIDANEVMWAFFEAHPLT